MKPSEKIIEGNAALARERAEQEMIQNVNSSLTLLSVELKPYIEDEIIKLESIRDTATETLIHKIVLVGLLHEAKEIASVDLFVTPKSQRNSYSQCRLKLEGRVVSEPEKLSFGTGNVRKHFLKAVRRYIKENRSESVPLTALQL